MEKLGENGGKKQTSVRFSGSLFCYLFHSGCRSAAEAKDKFQHLLALLPSSHCALREHNGKSSEKLSSGTGGTTF